MQIVVYHHPGYNSSLPKNASTSLAKNASTSHCVLWNVFSKICFWYSSC